MKDDTLPNDEVRQGVDIAKLRAFRTFAAENAEALSDAHRVLPSG